MYHKISPIIFPGHFFGAITSYLKIIWSRGIVRNIFKEVGQRYVNVGTQIEKVFYLNIQVMM